MTGYVVPPSRRDVTYGYYNMDKFKKKEQHNALFQLREHAFRIGLLLKSIPIF